MATNTAGLVNATDVDSSLTPVFGQINGAGGVGRHYWKIPPLPVPSGASKALKSFIAMAEAALQTAVDLLGRGTTAPPPRIDDLMTKVVYTNLGQSDTTDLYQKTLAAVDARRSSLLSMDDKVLDVANVMSAGKDSTLAAIKHLVAELVSALSRQTAAKLQPTEETALMDMIAKTISAVYEKVRKVAEDNLRMSGSGTTGGEASGGTPGGTSGGGNGQSESGAGGGEGSGLMQGLMQALIMIPVVGASAIPAVMQLIERQNEKNDREHPEGSGPPGTPAPSADPAARGGAPTPVPGAATDPAPGGPPPAPPSLPQPIGSAGV